MGQFKTLGFGRKTCMSSRLSWHRPRHLPRKVCRLHALPGMAPKNGLQVVHLNVSSVARLSWEHAVRYNVGTASSMAMKSATARRGFRPRAVTGTTPCHGFLAVPLCVMPRVTPSFRGRANLYQSASIL